MAVLLRVALLAALSLACLAPAASALAIDATNGECVTSNGIKVTVTLANCLQAATDTSTAAAVVTDGDCIAADSHLHIVITLANCVRT
jgi:hypothetical protein